MGTCTRLGRASPWKVLLLCTALGACSGETAAPRTHGEPGLALQRVFADAPLQRPLALVAGPAGGQYAVEQGGRVWRLAEGRPPALFVDLRARVDSGPNEAGLLGMAFDPAFARNGRVYLSYTRRGTPLVSVIARFTSADGGLTLAADSEQELLRVDQPYANHNGGNLAFGPDGLLYIGLGDGGSAGDPEGHGQNTQTLLGALLRIDVSGDAGYAIPADNPFADGGGRPEIYAWGLRNPWRWSFDSETGELWLGDVGQNRWEEIDRIQRGGNYAWNLREGSHCFARSPCEGPDLIDPVAEYGHDQGCSVTGGYVYRGAAMPGLTGVYLFADFCSGRIWGLFPDAGGHAMRQLLDSGLKIASFGQDDHGEVYVVDLRGGIYRLVAAD